MFKSDVKPSIRRTGAEIINFLVFRKYFGQIVAKNGGFEMNYSLYCKNMKLNLYICNDKTITLAKC